MKSCGSSGDEVKRDLLIVVTIGFDLLLNRVNDLYWIVMTCLLLEKWVTFDRGLMGRYDTIYLVY